MTRPHNNASIEVLVLQLLNQPPPRGHIREDWTDPRRLKTVSSVWLALTEGPFNLYTLKKYTVSFVFSLSFHISIFLQFHDERNIIKKFDKHDFVLIVY